MRCCKLFLYFLVTDADGYLLAFIIIIGNIIKDLLSYFLTCYQLVLDHYCLKIMHCLSDSNIKEKHSILLFLLYFYLINIYM